MIEKFDTASTQLIARNFELEGTKANPLTEQELFELLADRIAYMIEYQIDMLLSLLYRLDIDEDKINQALTPKNPEPANIALARLVIQRQKQRIETKKQYKQQNTDNWIYE